MIKPISDMVAFRMFQVDCAPMAGDGLHTDVVKCPLWKIRKRKLRRGDKRALQSDDNSTVKVGRPGSKERLEAYVRFYAENAANEVSVFSV